MDFKLSYKQTYLWIFELNSDKNKIFFGSNNITKKILSFFFKNGSNEHDIPVYTKFTQLTSS